MYIMYYKMILLCITKVMTQYLTPVERNKAPLNKKIEVRF